MSTVQVNPGFTPVVQKTEVMWPIITLTVCQFLKLFLAEFRWEWARLDETMDVEENGNSATTPQK